MTTTRTHYTILVDGRALETPDRESYVHVYGAWPDDRDRLIREAQEYAAEKYVAGASVHLTLVDRPFFPAEPRPDKVVCEWDHLIV